MREFLAQSGQKALPLILFDDEVVLADRYLNRSELARWEGITQQADLFLKGNCIDEIS